MSTTWDNDSKNYYDSVISPIKNSSNNVLFDELKKLSGSIVDLGCGIGEIIPFLTKNFKEVHAWDYSTKMIKKAMEKNSNLENVSFKVKDFLNINEKELFDVGLSINSLIDPNPVKINQMIKKFYNLLKKNGTLICVLPSIESYLYQEMIAQEKKLVKENILNENDFEHNEIDFLKGTIILGEEKQKAFYRFEIIYRFEKAGFKNIELSKVRYHWKDWFEAGQRYFPNEKEPWDWCIKCNK